MKYACIVIEGAADRPIESLGGRTPLDAAPMPLTTALALSGRVGTVVTIPEGCDPSPELAFLTLLGYDPVVHDPGRAGFDAAALGIELRDGDRVLCLSFLSLGPLGSEDEGLLRPCHNLSDAEVSALTSDLLRDWRREYASLCERWSLAGVVQSRALLHIPDGSALDQAETTGPAAACGHEPGRVRPRGHASIADPLGAMIIGSPARLREHDVNLARRDHNLPPVSCVWPWGLGRRLSLPDFREMHAVRASLVTDSKAARAIGLAAGLVIESARSTDLADVGRCASRGIAVTDLVIVYTGAIANADVEAKVLGLARIDRDVVKPLAESLNADAPAAPRDQPEWRILIAATHAAPVEFGECLATPVPVAICGGWIRSLVERPFTETAAAESDLRVDPGKDLMEYFLRAGLMGRRR